MAIIFEKLLTLHQKEALFSTRGFMPATVQKQAALEKVGQYFIEGFNAALRLGASEGLRCFLDDNLPAYYHGFAYEGAGMGLLMMDKLTLSGGKRFRTFMADQGAKHHYLMYVGAGWVFSKLPPLPFWANVVKDIQTYDPMLRWLMLDGYAFGCAYFNPGPYVEHKRYPKEITGYAKRAFDQGLGRCLWFIECADAPRIVKRLNEFDPTRRADLWAGIGLACTYAGGASVQEVRTLLEGSGEYAACFAQGVTFAVQALTCAGHIPDNTQTVARLVWQASTSTLSRMCLDCRDHALTMPAQEETPLYEHWRKGIEREYHGLDKKTENQTQPTKIREGEVL